MKMKFDFYKQMFIRTFDFKGKSTIAEFWIAFLYSMLFSVCAELIALPLIFNFNAFYNTAIALSSLYEVVIFIPMLALTIRRLHDANHSAWALLWLLIPFVGMIVLIVYLASPSQTQVSIWPLGVIKVEESNQQNAEPEQNVAEEQYFSSSKTSENNDINSQSEQNSKQSAELNEISIQKEPASSHVNSDANENTSQNNNLRASIQNTESAQNSARNQSYVESKQSETPENLRKNASEEPIKVTADQVIVSDTSLSRSERITKLQEMYEIGQINAEEYHKKVLEILKH